MKLNITTRYGAFAFHLLLSLVILISLLSVIFFIWFPYELIFAGGIDGLKILIGVDMVLGPLLTLIVFNIEKKELKYDLALIGLLQIGCLFAGMWLIYNERPMAQILVDDGVHILAASDFKLYDVELIDLPGRNPKNILMDIPEDRDVVSSIKFTSEFVEEKPFTFRSDLYIPMQNVTAQQFDSRIKFVTEPIVSNKEYSELSNLTSANCSWVPVHSKHVAGYACINQEKGVIKLSNKNY